MAVNETLATIHVDFISEAAAVYIFVIFYIGIHGVLGGLGSVANIINIIVFVKQGFKETVNISLLSLAVSDLGGLLALLWQGLGYSMAYWKLELPFNVFSIQYLTASWPHGVFTRITSCITAYLTFERCLCVATPLKIKDIITAKKTLTVMVLIFVVNFLNAVPVYCAWNYGPVYYDFMNKTYLGFTYKENGESIENISLPLSFCALIGSFVSVTICTAVLIRSLRINSLWRRAVTGASTLSTDDVMSTRDKKIMKVVTLVSLTFIICTFPGAVNLICMQSFPVEYSVSGPHKFTRALMWALCMVLEEINCSVNIFIYYHMSSQFRSTMRRIFEIKSLKYHGL